MKNLEIDYLMVYDDSGSLVFSGTVTPDGEIGPPVPADLDAVVHDSIIPEGMQTGIPGRRGISTLNNIPVILAGYTFVYGDDADPREGTLVMGRLLNQERIGRINQMMQMDGSLVPYQPGNGDTGLSPRDIRDAEGGAVIVHPSGDELISGYAMITGIENKPTLHLVRIEAPRPVFLQVRNSIAIVASAIILLSIIFLVSVQLLLQRYILGPLSGLDSGMKSIGSSGDLTFRIPENGDEEIVSLTRALNQMLDRIGSQQEELRCLVEEIEQQRDDLADARQDLAARNRDLGELNRKANLYLDVFLDAITYEILNAIMGLRGYAELVRENTGEKERHFAEKIIGLAVKSNNVIRNIETISRIYKNPPEIRPVDLGMTVKREIHSHPGVSVSVTGCNRTVLANDMLGVVFDNLFSNSIRFGGKDTKITVSARDTPAGMVEISVDDTGPGIPDALKSQVFDRFSQETGKRSSYGLGLHIVKMLVEGYGGTVWAEDRIHGDQASGASLHFTLRPA
jgi:signal transduction histidine kinase